MSWMRKGNTGESASENSFSDVLTAHMPQQRFPGPWMISLWLQYEVTVLLTHISSAVLEHKTIKSGSWSHGLACLACATYVHDSVHEQRLGYSTQHSTDAGT